MAGETAMSKETFMALAAAHGLDVTDGHLEALYPEVMALLGRVSTLHDIDASSVPLEMAVTSLDDGGHA